MRIKEAGCKKTGSAHVSEQAGDDVGIVDELREQRRGLQASQQLSQRLRQCARPARIDLQRLPLDEVRHCDAGRLVDMVDWRGNSRLRCDAHGDILMRIAQRTGPAFHPHQVAPVADLDPKGRCTRSSASHRRDRADRGGTKGGSQRRAHHLALCSKKRVYGTVAHDCPCHAPRTLRRGTISIKIETGFLRMMVRTYIILLRVSGIDEAPGTNKFQMHLQNNT